MPFRSSRVAYTLMTMACLALAGCGGGGGDDATSPTPVTSTPTTTTGGEIAKVTYGSVPGYNPATSNILLIAATNRGLYLQDDNAQGGRRVIKLHGDPSFSDAWSTADLGTTLATDVSPSNLYSERDREFSFWYTSLGKVGQYNANNGGVSREWQNDRGIGLISPGPLSGTFTGPWGVGGEMGTLPHVYLNDQTFSTESAGKVSDMFTNPIVPDDVSADLILAEPSNLRLYAARGNTLKVLSGTALLATETLPTVTNGYNRIVDMKWYDGKLWLSINGKVYRRDGLGIFTQVAQGSSVGTALPGGFCIKGGEILTSDGMATRITDGRRRSFISRGTLTTQQQLDATLLSASLTQVFCSPDNLANIVYAPDMQQPGKIRMIEIVSGN